MRNAAKAPPIKIQGIKTKLVPLIRSSIRWDGHGRWIEPFLGSGAVLFNLAPKRAIGADSNEHLIRFYRSVQTGELTPGRVRDYLEREGRLLAESGGSHYYEVRERFNSASSPYDFLFLNRACFNGVIRFNSRGQFNVPFCKKPERFSRSYITKIVNQVGWLTGVMMAREWEFRVADWRETLSEAIPGDFVYLDPPYNDRHTDYYTRWTSDDVDALAEAVKNLPSGFAYSTWRANKYRTNTHLQQHFGEYPITTVDHYYHVGSTEDLRHAMEEALVVAHGFHRESPPAGLGARHDLHPTPSLFD